jgi:enoyl-CoA hydratase/carnithine racemase
MRHQFAPNDRVSLALTEGGVADVRMTRADKFNALDPAMFDALIAAGHALFDMPGLRCVVLSGEGKAFCAGLDLASMASLASEAGSSLAERTHGEANRFQQVAMQWRRLPVPVIAAVHGVCFGGGLQIAAGADIRVAAPDARLAVMETKWGIVPDMGHFALWRGVVREDVLRELTYTARMVSGAEALELGLATMLDADPLARALALARDIAGKSPQAIRSAKALFNRAPGMSTGEVLLAESLEQHKLIGSRNQLEAVAAGMEKRAATFANP